MRPVILTPGSKLSDVFVAIREAGGRGLNSTELQAATGYGGHQTAPLLWWLERAGVIARAGERGEAMPRNRPRDVPQPGHAAPRPWPLPVYVTARALAMLGPAAGEVR